MVKELMRELRFSVKIEKIASKTEPCGMSQVRGN